MEPYKENPPPYSQVAGGPPPPGFVQESYPSQPAPYGSHPGPYGPQPTYPIQTQPYPFNNPQTVVHVTEVPAAPVIIMGGCPSCRVGVLKDSITCCGVFCCILFFPIGLLCLFLMTEKRCTRCGATFG